MRRLLTILFISCSVFIVAAQAAHSIGSTVKITTVCLLDSDTCQTGDYVAGALRNAVETNAPDIAVLPLTLFLDFREGNEAVDLKLFIDIAKKHSLYLAIALTERAQNGKVYFSSLLIDKQGSIAGKYRKSHALPDDKVSLGGDLPVFETELGNIAFSIGSDFYFPEVYWVEYMKGADIMIWQHYPERFREHYQWLPMLKSRALDSHAFLVTAMYADPRAYIANRYAMGMQGAPWGRSMIVNRVGTPVADTGYEEGSATAIIDLDAKKINVYSVIEEQNIFYVNNLGDRKAYKPITEPWSKPSTPQYRKRTARVAVGYFRSEDIWSNDTVPEAMLRVLDMAAELKPDIVLLSEMNARKKTATTDKTAEIIAAKAREMNAYICIGGLDILGRPSDQEARSLAMLWDRSGEIIFSEALYWPKGFPEIKVVDTDFARVGIHVCGDLYLGEIDRVLALKGAELILDPSQMWGADGFNNETLLRSRAIDNGCWIACSHWNSSDPGLRSLIVDPYGYVMGASQFQKEGAFYVDIDFDDDKVFYDGMKANQPTRGESGIPSYFTENLPEQRKGWRDMIFSRRRPELYGIIPAENEVTRRYRPKK